MGGAYCAHYCDLLGPPAGSVSEYRALCVSRAASAACLLRTGEKGGKRNAAQAHERLVNNLEQKLQQQEQALKQKQECVVLSELFTLPLFQCR